jgi:hypothetical protein
LGSRKYCSLFSWKNKTSVRLAVDLLHGHIEKKKHRQK